MGIEEEKPEELKEAANDMFPACYLFLKLLGGTISVPANVFDNFPKDAEIKITLDRENNKLWFVIPKKRTRGIIKPSGRLIVPN